jgi:hypothetical protein
VREKRFVFSDAEISDFSQELKAVQQPRSPNASVSSGVDVAVASWKAIA